MTLYLRRFFVTFRKDPSYFVEKKTTDAIHEIYVEETYLKKKKIVKISHHPVNDCEFYQFYVTPRSTM